MTLKSGAKFEEKLTCCLENGTRNLANFHQSTQKCQNWNFVQSRKCVTLKFTEELCAMTMKNDTKIEEKLTCRFKIDMRNFTQILTRALKSLKNVCFNWLFVTKVHIV